MQALLELPPEAQEPSLHQLNQAGSWQMQELGKQVHLGVPLQNRAEKFRDQGGFEFIHAWYQYRYYQGGLLNQILMDVLESKLISPIYSFFHFVYTHTHTQEFVGYLSHKVYVHNFDSICLIFED